ncbi:MAG: hypothetical protein M5U12_22135, partial [Verrucomicrobia bacterium]|nr:hypothetical protein [Verrucomicrobiota bacterium]
MLSLAPDGGFRWFRQLGGSHANADSIVDIDVDPAGTNIVAGGTVWGMAEYNYNAESYYFDDSNGYAAKLDGSGTVVSEWSLGGHPDDGGTWQFGHEYSSEGEYHWNTRVEHVCASGGGAVVAWTYPDENGRSVRKVGGSSQWHLGTGSYGSGWPVRDLLRAGGRRRAADPGRELGHIRC